ncbi:alpha-mannosyltransferase [Grosmannia clavigera kw1407]|uniref:Alpha-mannosyltransferase n=1 Tax=Grosmannia clavigera (strain kw1407 / UAMH 11150) TaxID=655863 RepID=F0XAR7_GROCL|nr:alpha-mannosyltransferase [Grosmannia clavigera kw1407]EFX05358.1 alpha-mannosyltransferase [Grosmannia clavigera kw1407]
MGRFRELFVAHVHMSRRLARRSFLASLISLLFVLVVIVTALGTAGTTDMRLSSDLTPGPVGLELAELLGGLLEQHRPSGVDPPWTEDRFDSTRWQWGEDANMTSLLQLDALELLKMRDAHRGFVASIHDRLPTFVAPSGHHSFLGRHHQQPRQGIVIIGGGKYFAILMVSLRFLRRTGTTLPVEVFVLEHEYEADVCEHVLPTLNAVCRIFPPLGGGACPLHGFQLKVFAILFASFEDVLFLDADCTAMRDVATLFLSEPFRATGLVTWPDIWQTTVSPLYYLIASQDVVPVARRASSESGQLVVSKRRHWFTLLLAAYYNYHGPDFYYRLLNQGGTGMGDKETFLPAADVFGLPFYSVQKPVVSVGHRFEHGQTGSRVQVQHDPVDDYAITQQIIAAANDSLDFAAWNASYAPVRPLFLHLAWPKWDAVNLLDHISKWSDMTTGIDGRPEPAFHYPPALAAQIHGTERMLWEEARWAVCNLHDRLNHWKNKPKAGGMCSRLDSYFRTVLDADMGIAMRLGPKDVLMPMLPE